MVILMKKLSVKLDNMNLLYNVYKLRRRISIKMKTLLIKSCFQSVGKNLDIDPTLYFDYPEKIVLEDNVQLRRGVMLIGRSKHKIGIYLGENSHIKENAYLDAYGGKILVGKWSVIGHGCIIAGHGGLTIGDYTGIGGLTYIIPANHIFVDKNNPIRFQGETKKGINIGKDVWIGCSSTILDGVTIGDHSVIGAGSVVTGDIPSWSIACGVPAKVIKKRK